MSECGKRCFISTGICGAFTFGQGELDGNGYWEIPCHKCARHREKDNNVLIGTYWPHPNELLDKGDTRILLTIVRGGLRFRIDEHLALTEEQAGDLVRAIEKAVQEARRQSNTSEVAQTIIENDPSLKGLKEGRDESV